MMWSLLLLAAVVAGPDVEVSESESKAKAVTTAVPSSSEYAKSDGELGQVLNEQGTVFLDRKESCLWLKTTVAQETGVLEMFLCRRGTKEHESVVAVDSPAFVIHAGLLALGLEPGQPARFEPEFMPPSGTELSITVHWLDTVGEPRSQPAGEWIRRVTQRWFTVPCQADLVAGIDLPEQLDIRFIDDDDELIWFGSLTAENEAQLRSLSDHSAWQNKVSELKSATIVAPFDGRWIFSGSEFWEDPESGEKLYQAESGNVICVANFGDAMIDVNIESSAQNASLMFEPWTERVPSRGTPVLIEIREKKSPGKKKSE